MSTTTVIPRNRTVQIESVIHIIKCADCSIDFGIGADFMARRRDDHETFYCPNGHGNHYPGPSETEKEKERLVAEKARLARELDAARSLARREAERRKTAEYQRRAAKGQLTKAKKRAAAGVCPCCNRTFANVARHMVGQHPDYVAEGR